MINRAIILMFFVFLGIFPQIVTPVWGVSIQGYPETPLYFTLNAGQTDSQVRFTARTPGCDLFLASSGPTLVLNRETEASVANRAAAKSVVFKRTDNGSEMEPVEREYHALKLRFQGANDNPTLSGEDELSWKSNYFIGNDSSQWKTDVPNYAKVRCHDLYPGVDMVYYGQKNRLKYDLVVQPGEDISKIALSYEGATGITVNEKGDLEIDTPVGTVTEKKPYCYQEILGARKEIAVRYVIRDNSAKTYGFAAESYDSRYPLIIDPELVYSTFLGGTRAEGQTKVAVDTSGCIYIAGITYSLDFPVTPGAYNSTISDTEFGDIYVTKFDQTGRNILFSTYIHGGRLEHLRGFSVDDDNNIYIAGDTDSSDFPRTPGTYSIKKNYDYSSLFVTKLNAKGDTLIFSSVFGDILHEERTFFGLDKLGHAYITSYGFIDPTPGCLQEVSQDHYGDLRFGQFICKLSEDGSRLLYATYYGGTGNVYSLDGFAVDREGNTYLMGTASKGFPTMKGALCDSILPPGYLCKINPEGNKMVFSTYLFGEYPYGLTLDKDGFIFLLTTFGSNFPISPGAYINSEGRPAILCKLSPDGSRFIFSARIFEQGTFMTIDKTGRIFLFGSTPYDRPPTTPNALNRTVNDLFFSAFDAAGTSLLYATYLGGSGSDSPGGIATDNQGNVYLSGSTSSADFPTTEGALSRTLKGSSDAFICKFSFVDTTTTAVIESPLTFELNPAHPNPFNPSTTITFSLPAQGKTDLAIYSINGQRVCTLISGQTTAGVHSVVWDGKDDAGKPVSSGVYLSRLTAGKQTAAGKMLLLR